MAQSQEITELPAALIAQFAGMVSSVPDYETSGAEGLISTILNAQTLDDVDAPWTTGRALPVGRSLTITGISKVKSDYSGGLGFYLVIEQTYPSTGETEEYTTGAVAVVAQLVKYHQLGELPVVGTIVEVESRNIDGGKSQHFQLDKADTIRARKIFAEKGLFQ